MLGDERTYEVRAVRAAERWRAAWDEMKRLERRLQRSESAAFGTISTDLADRFQHANNATQELENAGEEPEVVIATTGTTSSGKSTLANLLIGDLVLPKSVQEMSAGIVKVRHDEVRKQLSVAETVGATWETGDWQDITAEDIRRRLKTTMDTYRDLLERGADPGNGALEPPRFEVRWRTHLGTRMQELGLPPRTRLTIIDLPGLKYASESIENRDKDAELRRSLCLVAFNSEETDSRKQNALLQQVVDQVKRLGGGPARMLFILNRIDAFLTDEHSETSEQRFCERVTAAIRKSVASALEEYQEEASEIAPVKLSSEPALYAHVARANEGAQALAMIEKLERNYGNLFPQTEMRKLARSPLDWTAAQTNWFVGEAFRQSRFPEFDRALTKHITQRLPEIVLPDLVGTVDRELTNVAELLDAFIETQRIESKKALEAAKVRLEDLHNRFLELKRNVVTAIEPLTNVLRTADNLVLSLSECVPTIAANLDLRDSSARGGKLAPLYMATNDAISVPLQRLNAAVVALISGDEPDDVTLEASGKLERLRELVAVLRNGPFGPVWQTGGEFESKQGNEVKTALEDFARSLSEIATELVARESRIQSVRMKEALNELSNAMTRKLETETNAELEKFGKHGGLQFRALRGVFRGEFDLRSPSLPNVIFEAEPEEWSRIEDMRVAEGQHINKRTWRTLWLWESKVWEERQVVMKVSRKGIRVEKLGDLLDGFMQSRNVTTLEIAVGTWLRESLELFSATLEDRLKKGITIYQAQLSRRLEEVEKESLIRIQDLDKLADELSECMNTLDRLRAERP